MRSPAVDNGACTSSLVLLVKFCTARDHAEELRREGALLMRPLEYFANCNDGHPHARGDPNERSQPGLQVFSMYALTRERVRRLSGGAPLVDERALRLGAFAVLVRQPHELLRRLTSALRSAEVRSFRAGLVSYASDAARPQHSDPFHKSDAFAYQSEFRVVVELAAPVAEYRVVLGSLADLCEVVEATGLNRYLRA